MATERKPPKLTYWYRHLQWPAAVVLYALLAPPVLLLPRRYAVGLGALTGKLLFFLLRGLRSSAIRNITNSLPYFTGHPLWDPAWGTPERIAQQLFANLGRSLVEVMKLYYGLGRPILAGVEFRGMDNFRQAKGAGKGVILVTGHCGNWEVMALSIGTRIEEFAVVARQQPTPFFTEIVRIMREKYGNRVIYSKGAVRETLAALKRQGVVGILIDQAVRPTEGVLIDFFGWEAWTGIMPAQLTAKQGVPLVPTFVHREGERHVVTFHPPLMAPGGDVTEITRQLTRAIEDHIIQHPTEWLWHYRRWKRAAEWAPAKPRS